MPRVMETNPNEVKLKEVAVLKGLLTKYKTIAIIDLSNLPSPQLQTMRKKLEDTEIRVTKKRLLKIALKETGKGIENLNEAMTEGLMPAVVFTNMNSFKLAKFLRQNKSQVAAKPGQIAPNDIVISAGPTSLPAGPAIGELGAVGIKAMVEDGKISVREDAVVVKGGEEIKSNVADILTKLDIKPMEIGLNLVVSYEDNIVFKKEVLDVDENVYIDNLKLAVSDALKLTIGIGYVTKDNVQILLSKAQGEALGLDKVVNAERDKLKKDLAQGDKEANLLEKALPKAEEKKEEDPKEEASEEKPVEEEKKEEEKPVEEKKETIIEDEKPKENNNQEGGN